MKLYMATSTVRVAVSSWASSLRSRLSYPASTGVLPSAPSLRWMSLQFQIEQFQYDFAVWVGVAGRTWTKCGSPRSSCKVSRTDRRA